MKHPLIQSLLAISLSLGMATVATANTPSVTSSADGILAQVNDEIILKSEFITASQAMAREYRDRGIALSNAEIQNLAMNALITRKLQLGLVNRAGFSPNENAVNRELLAIASKEGFDNLADFQRSLDGKQAGSYAELRRQVIEDASLVALWQAQVRPRINISEQEVNAFLNSPEGQKIPVEQVLIPEWQTSHILVKVDDTQSDAIAQQKINALYSELQKGADFGAMAATYSDDTGSATQNGRLGWVTDGQMVAEFEAMMKNTVAGDFSTPFRTQFGWHILKVENTRQRDMSNEARKDKAREILFSRQAPQAEEDWVDELKAGAYIKIFE
ncbi:MAG: peptidylprolyl isomerase [Moraxella equi]|nr:peptidylprolyl isomerase [Moraxella equi]